MSRVIWTGSLYCRAPYKRNRDKEGAWCFCDGDHKFAVKGFFLICICLSHYCLSTFMVAHAQMAGELCLPYYNKLVGICISRVIGFDHCIGDDQFSINTGGDL